MYYVLNNEQHLCIYLCILFSGSFERRLWEIDRELLPPTDSEAAISQKSKR